MSTLNISARNYQIFVNRPNEGVEAGLDVTQYCTGDSGGFLTITINPFDESGLFQVTGQLILDVPAYDPAFDIWENPNRWSVGNYVWIKVAAANGTLYPLPVNRLYITRKPRQPMPGSWSLEIELGDLFTLYDAKQPSQIPSDIKRTRRSALQQMLSQIDTTLIGNIYNVDEGFFTFSTDETIVSQAGELAVGGFSGLYQDKDGNVRPIRLNYTPEWRLFKHTIGVDDAAEPESISNAARAADEISVTTEELQTDGTVEDGKYRGFTSTTETLSQAAIDPESTSTTEVTAVIRTENWNWVTSFSYSQTVSEQRARGLTVPESLYEFFISQGRNITYPGPFVLVDAFSSNEAKEYESSSEGRLLSHTVTIQKTRGEIFADFYQKTLQPNQSLPSVLSLTTAEQITTTYEYLKFDTGSTGEDSKGQVRKIKTEIKRPRGVVAASANNWTTQGIGGPTLAANPDTLITAEVQVQTWRKRSKDEWEYRNQVFRAGQVRSGTIKKFSALIKVKGEVIVSRAGDLQPPAAERRPSREELARPSNSLRNAVIVKSTLDRIGRRDRKLQIRNLRQTGARKVSELLTLLEGYREEGWRITTRFRDEWFWFKPFVRIDLEYNNRIYYGIADVVVFTLASSQAIVTADCMKIGRSTEAASSTVYPYQPLPSMAVQPNPDPFGTIPIGGLLPDPVGTPAEDDPNPELAFDEPIVLTIDITRPFAAESNSFGTFTFIEPASFEGNSNSEGEFTIGPQIFDGILFAAESNSSASFEFVNPGVLTLVGDWALDSTSWIDSIAGRNLSNVGLGSGVVFDSTKNKNVAWFGGNGEFTPDDYLQLVSANTGPLTTRSAGGPLSWRITLSFSIDFGNGYFDLAGSFPSNFVLVELVNQWMISFEGQKPVLVLSNGATLEEYFVIGPDQFFMDGVWMDIDVSFDAATGQITALLNNDPGLSPYTVAVTYTNQSPGNLNFGRNAPVLTRLADVKLYIEQ